MHRSASPPPPPPPPPSPLSPRAEPGASSTGQPPAARDDSSTGQPPAARDDSSTGQPPSRRENSGTPPSSSENALSMAVDYAKAMVAANVEGNDIRVAQAVLEVYKEVYQKLPPRLQEQARAHLNAGILKDARENYGLGKSEGSSAKALVGWAMHNIVLPIAWNLFVFIIISLVLHW